MTYASDSDQAAPAAARPWVGAVLGVVAVALFFAPSTSDVPAPAAAAVTPADISGEPARVPQSDPPVVTLGAFERDCQDCHFIFDRPERLDRIPMQHRDVLLDHGLNDRCLGCHDQKNRNLLHVGGGRTVTFADSSYLCAQCHGPTFRDWDAGAHGRSTGSWEVGNDQRGKLSCVSCHDPHAPAFTPMKPLPGPNTLRMGPPGGAHGPGHEPESPLMRSGAAPQPTGGAP